MSDNPRLMLAAPRSGAGKTTVTLALLTAMQTAGYDPVAFKCGPDYIDPMFHREVLGRDSHNLDLFLSAEDTVCGLLKRHSAGHGPAIIEGVMGYYDGVGGTGQAGSYDLARVSRTPAVLVLNARGAALSLAALAKGFADFRKPSYIAGLILNDCSAELYARLKAALEAESGLRLYGYLPRLPDCAIESRHLGLVSAGEIAGLREKLVKLGQAAAGSLDIAGLMALAQSAPPLAGALPALALVADQAPRIAVARDKAFCFYYPDNLDVLRQLGAELTMFSPLEDGALPENISALYIGGGYPELYPEQLRGNIALAGDIRRAVKRGLPVLAECGGFIYLQMTGALPGECADGRRLQRFGYVTLTAARDTMLLKQGESLPAHEFHYWQSNAEGDACLAQKLDGRSWPAIVATESLFAGFPHLYFYSNTEIAARFVAKAAAYGGMK